MASVTRRTNSCGSWARQIVPPRPITTIRIGPPPDAIALVSCSMAVTNVGLYPLGEKGDRNARKQTYQTDSFCRAGDAAPADAAACDRSLGAARACGRSDDRGGIGGVRRAMEGE